MKSVMTFLMTLGLSSLYSVHSVENNYIDTPFFPKEIKVRIFEDTSSHTNPGDLRLVCKNWTGIIDEDKDTKVSGKDVTYKNIGNVWRTCVHAWYGVTGNEDIFKQFLNGKLIYRPNPGIELKISDLRNPFAGNFDLSNFGDTGEYLAIMTGFRKEKIKENKNKVEVWIAPRFLIEKFRESTANHFEQIMNQWDEKTAPIGIFYTWGNWDNLSWYDYLTNKMPLEISTHHLYENWQSSRTRQTRTHPHTLFQLLMSAHSHSHYFHVSFLN